MEYKIFQLEELKNVGLTINDTGNTFFEKLQIPQTQAIMVQSGYFLTIIAKNGEKIIYNTQKLKSFSKEFIETIISQGDTLEKIDELVDNYNGRDTFGILINIYGKTKQVSEYKNIIDDSDNMKRFQEFHSKNFSTHNHNEER